MSTRTSTHRTSVTRANAAIPANGWFWSVTDLSRGLGTIQTGVKRTRKGARIEAAYWARLFYPGESHREPTSRR